MFMRSQTIAQGFAAVLLSCVLAACGGGGASIGGGSNGGSSSGSSSSGASSSGTSSSSSSSSSGSSSGGVAAASLVLLADTNQLPSNISATTQGGVHLSVLALDANNNVLPGVTVTFAADNNGVLTVTQPVTDSSGTALATLTTPSDKSNRVINIKATQSGVSKTLQVNVVGTTVTLSGPANLGLNQTGTYIVSVLDAVGKGIPGQSITVTSADGNPISPSGMLTTSNSNGQATFTLKVASANDVLTVNSLGQSIGQNVTVSPDSFVFTTPAANSLIGLNKTQAVTVQWLQNGTATNTQGKTVNFATTRGSVSPTSVVLDATGSGTINITSTSAGPALIQASSAALTQPQATLNATFVATDAASVNVQASPFTLSTNSQSVITAVVRDPKDNLVANRIVDFNLSDVSVGTLSAASAVTNSQGVASVIFSSSSTSSGYVGETITASVEGTSPVVSNTANLTIGGQALRIVLGTGNQILAPSTTLYQDPYSVIVTDSAGHGVPNSTVQLSVVPLAYFKGSYVKLDGNDLVVGSTAYNGFLIYVPSGPTVEQDPVVNGQTIKIIKTSLPWECPNEDVNLNGVLDPGEDTNQNGQLDPTNVAEVVPVPPATSITLDPNGQAQFYVQYPKSYANWVAVRLVAQATVAGTETTETTAFTLPVLFSDVTVADISPPGGLASPFGVAPTCLNTN